MALTYYRGPPLRDRPGQGTRAVDPGPDIAGHPSVPGYGEPRRDFAGTPAIEQDASHISPEVRSRLSSFSADTRAKLERPADTDPSGAGYRPIQTGELRAAWRDPRPGLDAAQGGPGDFRGRRKSLRRV